jgi:tetratricopeptide (TPR) repeat protein
MNARIPLLFCLLALSVSCTTDAGTDQSFQARQNRLGTLYLDHGEYEMAIDAFDEVLADHPDDSEASYGKILACLGSKRYDQAIELADQAFERYPQRLRFPKAKAAALVAKKDFSAALEVYETLLSLDTGDYDLHAQVMQFALDHGFDETAREEASFLLARNMSVEDAVSVLASLEGPESTYALIETYLDSLT